jgi:hypothetical protein
VQAAVIEKQMKDAGMIPQHACAEPEV